MANPFKQWRDAEFNGLLIYVAGDLIEALAIMRVIHPRMELPFNEDRDLHDFVEQRARDINAGG